MAATRFDPRTLTTIRAVGLALGEVHDCLHAVDIKVGDARNEIKAVDTKVETVKNDMRTLRIQMAMMAMSQGIAIPSEAELLEGALPRKVRRKVTSLTPLQLATMLIPAVISGMGAYKLLEPAVISFFSTLHAALMASGR